jgi:predicted  nucleic acid-binding Zn-ribbon protein
MLIDELRKQGQRLRTQQHLCSSDKTKQELEVKITALKNRATKIAEEIKALENNVETYREVKHAYVTFRSMEGHSRLLQAYEVGKFKRMFLFLTCRRS